MGSRNKNTYNTLWIAMFSSSVIYFALAFFIKKYAAPPVDGPVFLAILAAVAVSCLICSIALFNILFAPEKIRAFTEFYMFTSYFQQKTLICMSLMADIGVIGVLLKIFGFSFTHAAAFIVAGAVGLIIHRLQAEALWKSVIEDAQLMAKMKMLN